MRQCAYRDDREDFLILRVLLEEGAALERRDDFISGLLRPIRLNGIFEIR